MDVPLDELAEMIRALLAAGRSGEAVLSASRLVEAVGSQTTDAAPPEVAEAKLLLARAFAADDDAASAEQVVRTLLTGLVSDDAGLPGSPLQVRTATLLGRYLREKGDLRGSARHLGETLERLSRSTHPDVRAELAVTRTELARSLRELGGLAWSEGLIADAVDLYRAGVDLLAPDGSVSARRERAGLRVSAAQGLAMLQRWRELRELCDGCVSAMGADGDAQTVESSVVAGCMSAQAALALGCPDDALTLTTQLAAAVPTAHPNRIELNVRIGLARAAAEREIHGSAAAEAVYAAVTRELQSSLEPSARVFLAIALELDCAMLCQLDEMDRAGEVGRELAAVIAQFPAQEDLATAAECGNRAADRLISYGEVHVAAMIALEVTSHARDRLTGDDSTVALRGYVIAFDALRRSDQASQLERCWGEIIALDDDALAVLDGLAERYGQHPALRAALLDTYIGRAAVLSRLGRTSEAEQTLRQVLEQFAQDDDVQVQRMLRSLRSGPGR